MEQLKVEFAVLDNDTTLVAKVHAPHSAASDVQQGAERKISVALEGDSRLNIRVELQNGPFQTTMTQTEILPRRVSPDSIKISPADKGDILIRMKITHDTHHVVSRHIENSDMDDIFKSMLQDLFDPSVFVGSRLKNPIHDHDLDDDEDDPRDEAHAERKSHSEKLSARDSSFVREHLPSAAHVDRCQKSTSGDKLKYRKCLCDVVSSVSQRLICYTKFVSSVLSEARRLGKTDFATKTKEMAVACTNNNESNAQCMERVAAHVLETVDDDTTDVSMHQLRQQMRNALENEDSIQAVFFTPSNTVGVILGVLVGAIFLSLAFWAGMILAMRRGWFGNRTGGFLSQLSSVLAQSGTLARNGSSTSGDLPTSRSRQKRAGKAS